MRLRRLIALIPAIVLATGSCAAPVSPSPSGPASTSQPGASPTAAGGQPVDGGTFTYAVPSDVVSLDVDEPGGTTSVAVKNMIYEGLVRYNPTASVLEIEPWLATDWEAEGTTWTFNLRSDVSFHDGTPFDAEAVKSHFDRLLGPTEPLLSREWVPFMDGVEVIDADTVQFNMKFEDPAVLARLAGPSGHIESPAALEQFGEDLATNPVGTGPFKFVEWTPEVSVELERNDDYWGGRPHLDGVSVRPMPETGARLIAVQSGDVHLAANIAPEQVAEVEGDAELTFDRWPTTRQIFVGMHNLKEPFDDPRVRQALNHAVDWESIASTIYQGMAEPIGGPVTPTSIGYAEVSPFSYDPDRARSLLAEANLADGFDVVFTATNGSYLKDFELEQVLQQQLGEVGVRLDLQVVEFARYIELVRQPTQESELVMWIDSWGSDLAAGTLRDRYHCDMLRPAGVNITGYCNSAVDPLIEQAERTLDEQPRLAALAEAQQLVAQDAPSIWGVVQQSAWAASPNIHGALHGQGEGVWADVNTWLGGE